MSTLKVVLLNHDTTSDLYPKSDAEIIDYTDLNDNLMSVKKFLDSLKLLMSRTFTGELDNLVDVLETLGDDYDSLLAIANKLKDFLEGESTTEAIDNWNDLMKFLEGIKDGDTLKDMIDAGGETALQAYNQANAAYSAANGANDLALQAYNQANSAYTLANAAYNAANDKLPLAGGTMTGNIVLGTSQGRIFPNGAIKLDSGIILY